MQNGGNTPPGRGRSLGGGGGGARRRREGEEEEEEEEDAEADDVKEAEEAEETRRGAARRRSRRTRMVISMMMIPGGTVVVRRVRTLILIQYPYFVLIPTWYSHLRDRSITEPAPAERAHNKFYKSRIPSQYFTLHSFILSATLSPRSPGPSGSPPPTRSGPEPLWIHPRPTRPRGTSQPPVHAAGAGKPRPTVICCEVADKNQYNKLLGVVRITVQEFKSPGNLFLCEVSHSLAQCRHPSILLYPACRHFWSKSVLSFFPFFFFRRLFALRLKLSIFDYPVPLFGTNFYKYYAVGSLSFRSHANVAFHCTLSAHQVILRTTTRAILRVFSVRVQ